MGCTCKTPIDRRKNPTYGYRAVHVIVYWDGIPVEIQIRTELQDTWAQIVERRVTGGDGASAMAKIRKTRTPR